MTCYRTHPSLPVMEVTRHDSSTNDFTGRVLATDMIIVLSLSCRSSLASLVSLLSYSLSLLFCASAAPGDGSTFISAFRFSLRSFQPAFFFVFRPSPMVTGELATPVLTREAPDGDTRSEGDTAAPSSPPPAREAGGFMCFFDDGVISTTIRS